MGERSASTIVIWVIAAALAVLAAVRLAGDGGPAPPPVEVDAHGGGAGNPAAGRSMPGARGVPGGASSAELYVHAAGAVRRPGLIRLPEGARVAEALERAGGPARRADLTLVNLAARVQDGQQIVVPVRGATGNAGATASEDTPVHLSTATVEQLDEIDGIGPTLAERIVEYRDAHGGFRSVDELAEVEGIGEKRLATLREAVQP